MPITYQFSGASATFGALGTDTITGTFTIDLTQIIALTAADITISGPVNPGHYISAAGTITLAAPLITSVMGISVNLSVGQGLEILFANVLSSVPDPLVVSFTLPQTGYVYPTAFYGTGFVKATAVTGEADPLNTQLFTTGPDTVNFNALTSLQTAAIVNGADIYHGLGGNDSVTLPNKANYSESIGNGQTLGWVDSATAPFTTGSKVGDTYSINGGDGNYYIKLGAGSDNVIINGNGSSNITAGSGADTITINGLGNNTVSLGLGTTTLKPNGTALTSVAFTGAANQVVKIANPGASPIRLAISGFVSGDAIDFVNQAGLTLSAAFSANGGQDPGEVDVYSHSTLIAVLDFTGTNIDTFVNTLEPYSDNAGGTKVIVDPNQPVALSDPQGTSIIWSFIHSNEGGNLLVPYVPVPDTSISGLTVGVGVDLANGLIRQTTYSGKYGDSYPGFSTLFPDYASDPNLKFLFDSMNPAKKGADAATYLQANGDVQTSFNSRGLRQSVTSTSVSITQSQANKLSNASEQYQLTELRSVWAAKSSTPFTSLPAQAQTVLYDIAYQYNVDNLPTGKKTKQFFSDILAAAQTISPQNPNGTLSTWVPVYNDLTHFGDNYTSRRLDEAALILQIPGVVPDRVVPPVLKQGTVVASNESYNFGVTDTTTQYALDPVGATTYLVLADTGSPNFSSIELPLTTADQYAVSYEVGTAWSQPQIVQPLQTLNLPANVVGLQVALEDSTGHSMPDPGSFTFYVTFANPGTFSGKVIDVPPAPNPPPPGGTTADMILRDGTNGDFEIYNLGSNAILAAAYLGQVGLDWQFVGLGGFYGADTSDMILRNSADGAFEFYDISNNNITNAALLGTVGLDWQFGGFGDFSSRPDETDMILRNSSTAALEVYDISNNSLISAYSMGAVGLDWRVAGFGDFSGSPNETDMIMRNVNTGALEVYDIANNALISAYSMGAVGLDWQVAGFGKFSGVANETDMIMRNSHTGAFEVYDIANNALVSAYSMGVVGLDWQVAGFGDLTGNPDETDMILRNVSTGALEVYDIANNALTGASSMGAVGLNWQAAGIAAHSSTGSTTAMGDSNQVAQLVQAMAGFAGGSDAADGLNAPVLGADISEQAFLASAQHG
jgi:hypothetical protein